MATEPAPTAAPRPGFVHPSPVHFDELDGFECFSEAGVHARGRRTVVKVEPATLSPAAWSERFREAHGVLLRAGRA